MNNEQLLKQVRERIKGKIKYLSYLNHQITDFPQALDHEEFNEIKSIIAEQKTELLALHFMEKMLGEPSEAVDIAGFMAIHNERKESGTLSAYAPLKAMVEATLKEIKEEK